MYYLKLLSFQLVKLNNTNHHTDSLLGGLESSDDASIENKWQFNTGIIKFFTILAINIHKDLWTNNTNKHPIFMYIYSLAITTIIVIDSSGMPPSNHAKIYISILFTNESIFFCFYKDD